MKIAASLIVSTRNVLKSVSYTDVSKFLHIYLLHNRFIVRFSLYVYAFFAFVCVT